MNISKIMKLPFILTFLLIFFINLNIKSEEIDKKKSKIDFYDYIDDDIRPLTLIWHPGINFFWSANGTNCKNAKSAGFDSTNLLRLMFMYDYQLSNSHFFISPGIGWSKTNFVFDKKFILFKGLKNKSKVEFRNSSEILKLRAENDVNINYSSDNVVATGCIMNYIEAALEFQFRGDSIYYKEGFFGALGIKAGYLISNPSSYIQFKDKDIKKETLFQEPLGISSWKINIICRFGYRIFGCYIDFSLTNIFISNEEIIDKEYSLKPITIGISIDLL